MSNFKQVALMAKCRPQNADARKIAQEHQRIFVGYAPWEQGAERTRDSIATSMLDIGQLEYGWDRDRLATPSHGRMVETHRRLAHEVDDRSMVAVPRPSEGVVYLAPIVGRFELVSDPEWADDYLSLRQAQGLDADREMSHVSDVCQTWPTGEFRRVPLPLVPGWIVKSLLTRHQICRIGDRPHGQVTALKALRSLYEDGQAWRIFQPTDDVNDVKARLQTWLTPRSFEHFVCNVLGVLEPHRRWVPVGGSGDGGADGIAIESQLGIVAGLQCKFSTSRSPYRIGQGLRQNLRDAWGEKVTVYVATLFDEHDAAEPLDGVAHLGPTQLAELVIKHQSELPTAQQLGVGKS